MRMTHLSYWVEGLSLMSSRWLIFKALETSFKESDTNDTSSSDMGRQSRTLPRGRKGTGVSGISVSRVATTE